jgi:hypothetical protein
MASWLARISDRIRIAPVIQSNWARATPAVPQRELRHVDWLRAFGLGAAGQP